MLPFELYTTDHSLWHRQMCLAHECQLTPHRISPRALHTMHAELDAGCDYSNYSLYSLRAQPKVGQRGGHWVNCFCFPPIWRKKQNEQKQQQQKSRKKYYSYDSISVTGGE